jgi:hypothetical protein
MTRNVLFSISNKGLVVTDLANGQTVWSGRPLDRDVVDLIQLDEAPRAIVLLESYGSPLEDRSNLVAIDQHGCLVWRAVLPTNSSTDCFTSVEVVDGQVSAFSWSSHRVLIDVDSGSTLSDEFTK